MSAEAHVAPAAAAEALAGSQASAAAAAEPAAPAPAEVFVEWANDTPLVRPGPIYERYCRQRVFFIDERAGYHTYLFIHLNELALVGVGRHHPRLRAADPTSIAVDFGRRTDNAVSGKRKLGAQKVRRGHFLAHVTCRHAETGQDLSFYIRSPVHGSLIEVNEALVQEPQRLLEAPYAEGYVAILSVSSDRRAQALAAGIPDEVAYDGAAAAASIDFSTLHSTSAPGTDNNDGSDAADSDTEEGTAEAAAPMVDEGHAEGEGKLTTRRAEEDLEGGPPGKLAHYNQASDNSSSGKR